MTKVQEKLVNDMIIRFAGTWSLSNEEIDYIRQEFNFTPRKGYQVFLRGTGSTNGAGKPNRQVFLGFDGYNVGQHICYI